MNEFIDTIDVLGEQEFRKEFFARTLTEFRDSHLTSVASTMLRGFSALSIIDLPNCKILGGYPFSGCSKLLSVNLPYISSTTDYLFAYTGISSTDCIPPQFSTTIVAEMFSMCKNLSGELRLDPGIETIRSSAFTGTAITRIDSPYIKYLYQYAFASCSKLEYVNLPNYIPPYSYSNYCFSGCTNLTEAYMPALPAIPVGLLADCAISTFSIPIASIIWGSAFLRCSNLSTVYIGQDSCSLNTSGAFAGTKITFATGSIYVPASRVDYYRNSTNWNWFSTQIKGYDYENDRPVD